MPKIGNIQIHSSVHKENNNKKTIINYYNNILFYEALICVITCIQKGQVLGKCYLGSSEPLGFAGNLCFTYLAFDHLGYL